MLCYAVHCFTQDVSCSVVKEFANRHGLERIAYYRTKNHRDAACGWYSAKGQWMWQRHLILLQWATYAVCTIAGQPLAGDKVPLKFWYTFHALTFMYSLDSLTLAAVQKPSSCTAIIGNMALVGYAGHWDTSGSASYIVTVNSLIESMNQSS